MDAAAAEAAPVPALAVAPGAMLAAALAAATHGAPAAAPAAAEAGGHTSASRASSLGATVLATGAAGGSSRAAAGLGASGVLGASWEAEVAKQARYARDLREKLQQDLRSHGAAPGAAAAPKEGTALARRFAVEVPGSPAPLRPQLAGPAAAASAVLPGATAAAPGADAGGGGGGEETPSDSPCHRGPCVGVGTPTATPVCSGLGASSAAASPAACSGFKPHGDEEVDWCMAAGDRLGTAGTPAGSGRTSPGLSGWAAASTVRELGEGSVAERLAQLQESVKLRLRSFEDEQQRQWSHVQKALSEQAATVRDAAERAAKRQLGVVVERLQEDLRDLAARSAEEAWAEIQSLRSVVEQHRAQDHGVEVLLHGQGVELAFAREEAAHQARALRADLEAALRTSLRELAELRSVVKEQGAALLRVRDEANSVEASNGPSPEREVQCFADREALSPERGAEPSPREEGELQEGLCPEGSRGAGCALQVGPQQAEAATPRARAEPELEAQALCGAVPQQLLEALEREIVGLRAGSEEIRALASGHTEQLASHESILTALQAQVRGYGRAHGELSRESLALVEAVLRLESAEGGGGLGRLDWAGLATPRPRDRVDALREETLRHLARLALRVELPWVVDGFHKVASGPLGGGNPAALPRA